MLSSWAACMACMHRYHAMTLEWQTLWPLGFDEPLTYSSFRLQSRTARQAEN